MKSPICEICLKSGLLCSACQGKVSTGELKQSDVDILSLIYKESERNNVSDLVEIKKIIDAKDALLIVCSHGSAAKIVGRGGYFAKKLKEDLKKPVRVVEESKDTKSFLQGIIFPGAIVNLNIVYTPKGESYRIVLRKNSKLSMPVSSFKSLASELLGKEVEIDFE